MEGDFENWLSERREHEDTVSGESELLPGTVIGDYHIIALLGRGGFAEVYKARNDRGELFAIKILHRLDGKSRARFERESGILSQIRHPNIPRLLGFGSCGNRPYMVTELLKGFEFPQRGGEVAAFLVQICSAVEELHRYGYVHRDIKPSNILSRDDGTPVLIDFGLACPISEEKRETEALSVEEGNRVAVGTAGFSAPEQFNGLGACPESDVHAVGALINECFGGRMPRCWKGIYLTATASNPKSRYPSMGALRKAIRFRHWRLALTAAAVVGLVATAVMLPAPFENRELPLELSVSVPLSPCDEDAGAQAAELVSELYATIWFRTDAKSRERCDDVKRYLEEVFVEYSEMMFGFDCSSAAIRKSCKDTGAVLDCFRKFAKEALEKRNREEEPEESFSFEIVDMELHPE